MKRGDLQSKSINCRRKKIETSPKSGSRSVKLIIAKNDNEKGKHYETAPGLPNRGGGHKGKN